MDMSEYQADVHRTQNPDVVGIEILKMSALKLTAEAGEVSDIVGKHCYQDHGLPAEELVKELGDILYYLTICSSWLGYGLDEIAKANVAKREERYPDGWDRERSINR